MKHIRTEYRVDLLTRYQSIFGNVIAKFDGTYRLDKEMWATYPTENNTCEIKFFERGKDSELYKLGFSKVIKMERVDIYEERTKEIDLNTNC